MMRRRFHPIMQRCLVSIISTCNIILRHTNSIRLYVDCGEIESIHVEWTKTTPRVYCRKRQALTCDRWISPTNQITTPNGVSFYSGYQSGRRRHYWGSQVLFTVYTQSGGYTASIYAGAIKNKLENVINKKKYNKHKKTKNKPKKKPPWTLHWETYLSTKEAHVVSYKRLWIQYFIAW